MASNLPIICFKNNFNRQRLGKEGLYLNNISELEKILNNFQDNKIEYNMAEESEEREVGKIQKILKEICLKK
jgi:hypothetical protein